MILPGTSRDETREIVDRLRRNVAGGVGEPSVTISAGLATFPTDAASVDELVAAADEALYESKRAGRDTVRASARHIDETLPTPLGADEPVA